MELLRHGIWVHSTSDVTASYSRGFVGLHTQQQSMRVLVGMCLSKHLEFFFPPFWWKCGGISLWLLFDFADN